MAALAYVLLPISGLVAYLKGSSSRVRFHGLQAIAFGALWAVLLYAATWTTPAVTQVIFAAGVLVWLVLILGAIVGRDWHLPLVGAWLESVAQKPPAGEREASMR
ncbi:MAG: hypothetical protein QOH48_1379 [Actinomycetota bacterium]|nr:hypothetical protein [Actinomycetota bacterium]